MEPGTPAGCLGSVSLGFSLREAVPEGVSPGRVGSRPPGSRPGPAAGAHGAVSTVRGSQERASLSAVLSVERPGWQREGEELPPQPGTSRTLSTLGLSSPASPCSPRTRSLPSQPPPGRPGPSVTSPPAPCRSVWRGTQAVPWQPGAGGDISGLAPHFPARDSGTPSLPHGRREKHPPHRHARVPGHVPGPHLRSPPKHRESAPSRGHTVSGVRPRASQVPHKQVLPEQQKGSEPAPPPREGRPTAERRSAHVACRRAREQMCLRAGVQHVHQDSCGTRTDAREQLLRGGGAGAGHDPPPLPRTPAPPPPPISQGPLPRVPPVRHFHTSGVARGQVSAAPPLPPPTGTDGQAHIPAPASTAREDGGLGRLQGRQENPKVTLQPGWQLSDPYTFQFK